MTRTVDEGKRQEFYRIMQEDSNRLVSTIENIMGDFTGVEWHPDEAILGRLLRISPSGDVVKFVLLFQMQHQVPLKGGVQFVVI